MTKRGSTHIRFLGVVVLLLAIAMLVYWGMFLAQGMPVAGIPILSELVNARYCQILWIETSLAANTDGVCVNRSAGAGSDWNISASPFGNSTPALTRATR
jgi:hypothetical protein